MVAISMRLRHCVPKRGCRDKPGNDKEKISPSPPPPYFPPTFGIHAGIERAKVGVLSAQLSKDQTAQSLTQTVQTAWADARAAERTFEANDKALEAATLAMDNAEARFEAGAISALEYADARTRWFGPDAVANHRMGRRVCRRVERAARRLSVALVAEVKVQAPSAVPPDTQHRRFIALVAGELGELRAGRRRPRGGARSLRN